MPTTCRLQLHRSVSCTASTLPKPCRGRRLEAGQRPKALDRRLILQRKCGASQQTYMPTPACPLKPNRIADDMLINKASAVSIHCGHARRLGA